LKPADPSGFLGTDVVVGLVLSRNFGQTWDDRAEAFYGKEVVDAYQKSTEDFEYEYLYVNSGADLHTQGE
jgi:hypothetical protein